MGSPKNSSAGILPLREPWSLLDEGPGYDGVTTGLRWGLGPLVAVPARHAPWVVGHPEKLPEHGPAIDLSGTGWPTFDVPAPDRYDEQALRIRIGDAVEMVRLRPRVIRTEAAREELVGRLQRFPEHGPSTAIDPSATSWQMFDLPAPEVLRAAETAQALETTVDSLVGFMLELRAQAEQHAIQMRAAGQDSGSVGTVGQLEAFQRQWQPTLVPLPWDRVTELLRSSREEPRMDVIVGIALNYQSALERLAHSPRRILRRQRRMIALGRVQQLDHACLEWFVRQPGHTAVEKAGPRQELLALARTEDYDTLENRVLKDFLRLAIEAADRYLREHQGRYEQHVRYRAVVALRETSRRLLRDTPLVQVRSLSGLPQPNYVLLHDAAYRELWHWYLKLVHRRKVNDDAWRWQTRLWADFVRLCVACELISTDGPRNGFRATLPFAHELWIRYEQDAGCWLHPVDWPGPICLQSDHACPVIAQLLHPHVLSRDQQYAGLPVGWWVALTGASLAVLFSAKCESHVCLLVWAVHSAGDTNANPTIGTQAQRAAAALARLAALRSSAGVTFRGLIVRSSLSGEATNPDGYRHPAGTEVFEVQVPPDPAAWQGQESAPGLREALFHCAALATQGG